MVDLRCPHDPIIGECPECAAIKRRADQAAALEARMEAIARKVVVEHMGDCPSYASLRAENERLQDKCKSYESDFARFAGDNERLKKVVKAAKAVLYHDERGQGIGYRDAMDAMHTALKKLEEG